MVILSLGAIHTPKLLMQSGIGDEVELKRFDIPVLQHLPGVGRNFQDHFMSPCVWEANEPITGRNNLAEATAVWKSSSALDTPDLQTIMVERLYASPQVLKSTPPPHLFWALSTAVVRTMSRGRLHLTGAGVHDPIEIEAAALDDPDDVTALKNCLEFCRAIGNSSALHPFAKREFLPGPLRGAELDNFICSATVSHSHQTCTVTHKQPPSFSTARA